MILGADYDFNNLHPNIYKGSDNNIYTLDMEVTNLYVLDNEIITFNYNETSKYYEKANKIGIMYIWQLSINDDVVYGRTLNDLYIFLTRLKDHINAKIFIYVHNLSYEFQFLLNIITDFEVFARKARKPIRAYSPSLDIEFRCSYLLTNSSLKQLAKDYKLPVMKLKYNYDKLRLPCTELTDDEYKYCENDVVILYHIIKKYLEQYKYIYKIPYTQTARIRKVIQNKCKANVSYMWWIKNRSPVTFEEFNVLIKAYSGGYTHANAHFSCQVLNDVYSADIVSSYPSVMICEKFPCSNFNKINISKFDKINRKERAFIIDITFINLRSILSNNYLSKSKAIKCDDTFGITEDNGRVVIAKSARYILTDVDYDIVLQAYKWDSVIINSCYTARKEYIRTPELIPYILELFGYKTSLKGDEDMEELYRLAKEYINCIYGMTVTNLVKDETEFKQMRWMEKILTKEDIENKLTELKESNRLFLLYSWGVYITAYARRNLWDMIIKIDDDVVYCDTDSIKYVNVENKKYFDEYNNRHINKMKIALDYHGIDYKLMSPIDKKGKPHQLGIYQEEQPYTKFVTMGAKKYCFIQNNKLHITVSGVNKHKGWKQVKSIKNFKEGLTFNYRNSGRMIVTYNNNQPEITVKDYKGNEMTINQKYGINMMPTTYTLGLSSAYQDYITGINSRKSNTLSMIGE